jgi:PAS domain S-box-containing protein
LHYPGICYKISIESKFLETGRPTMSLLSAFYFFSFIFYLCLVLYILFKNPKPLINKIISAFISSFVAWNFANIIIYSPYATKDAASLFNNIGSLGWLSFPCFFLLFMLIFTGKREILKKRYFYPALLALPLLLLILQWNGLLLQVFARYSYGWRSRWPGNFAGYLFLAYFLLYMGAGLGLAFAWMRKAAGKLERRQAAIIFFTTLAALATGVAFDIILPMTGIYEIPPMSSLITIIWVAIFVYTMVIHKFLATISVTPISNIKTTMFDCLILLTGKGKIVSANDAALNLLGYNGEELKGQPISMLLGEKRTDHRLEEKIIAQSLRSQDLVFRSKTGKTIPVTFSSSLLMSDEEKVEGIVCVARDISELKKNELIKDVLGKISETALWAETLTQLLEIIHRQVCRLMDGRNFYVALVHDKSRALYTFPFIVDVNPEELVEPGTVLELKGSFTDYVLRTDKPLLTDKKKYDELASREDIRLIGKQPLSWMGAPLKTQEDGVIGVVVIQSYTDESAYTASDMYVLSIVSNTIAGAIKYKQAADALKQSEEHYRTLVDNIQDGVFLIHKGRMEFINDAFARMLGRTAAELKGINYKQVISPIDMERVVNRYQERQKGNDIPEEYEFRMVHKDGSDVFVNIHVGLVKYKDGVASMGTAKDITGRKEAEKEKAELEERLARSEKMEAIGRLAGGVAHDLNNVLSAIVSYPDYILMKLPEGSPLRKSILTMRQSGQKAAAIVQDLLTLARRGVNIKEIINLNHTVTDYLKSPEFEKLTKHHPDVQLDTQLEEDLFNIKGSPIHLSKTVMNLVSNAVEAMPVGGNIQVATCNRYIEKPLKGYYKAIPKGSFVVLTVADTGTGIAPGDLDKIFDPFYTKKEMGRSGTGLGMAVVWGAVEDHKGVVDVRSTEGKGTVFELYFPVTVENCLNREVAISISEYMGRGEHILVVDDELDQREIASALLTELGYSVETVPAGEDAIEYFENQHADLLLLDMLMSPGIDGLDTYAGIVKSRPGLKAIITSGFSESDRVKKALKLGAGAYIKKPYTMKKLATAVRKELDK